MTIRTVLTMFGVPIVLVLVLLVSGGVAHAEPQYLTDFTTRYGNTGTQAASCKLCHGTGNNAASLNSYGRDIQAACGGVNACITVGNIAAVLPNVETLNSDGVGGTNITEIRDGAQPGWCLGSAPCDTNGFNPTLVNISAGNPVSNLNLDPVVNVLWQNTVSGDVHVYLMNGTTVASGTTIAQGMPLDWKIVGTGDFNSNSKKDILWQNTATGYVHVWLMNGTTVASQTTIAQGMPLDWKIVGTGDFNGDGNWNILWQHAVTGDVYVWLMNGTTVASQTTIAQGIPLAWKIVGTRDFDGDGKSDIIWQNTSSGDVHVWFMNGATVASQTTIVHGSNTSWSVVGPK